MLTEESPNLHVPLQSSTSIVTEDAIHLDYLPEQKLSETQNIDEIQQVHSNVVEKQDQQGHQQQQQEQPEERRRHWTAACIACEIFFSPCTLTQFIVTGPFMLPDLLCSGEFEKEACSKLVFPFQCVLYPLFCCCYAFPVMGLDDPNIDYFGSCKWYFIYRCPALMFCSFCWPDIPMNLEFMRE